MCVDASLVVKWLVSEVGSEEAVDLLDRWEDTAQLWAPDLLYVECANAIRRRAVLGAISSDDVQPILTRLLRFDVEPIPGRELVHDATMIALAAGVSVWDACYIAVAQRVGAELWTADQQLYTRGRRVHAAIHLLVP